MALRSYAGWLAEKARDKAVVAAAGWVDLYVAGVEGARESLAAAGAVAAAAAAVAAAARSKPRLIHQTADAREHAKHNWVATWLRSHSRRYRGGRRDTAGGDAKWRKGREKTRGMCRETRRSDRWTLPRTRRTKRDASARYIPCRIAEGGNRGWSVDWRASTRAFTDDDDNRYGDEGDWQHDAIAAIPRDTPTEDAIGVYTRRGCAQLCGRARPAALFSSLPLKQ